MSNDEADFKKGQGITLWCQC